jgi:transglutaminase-like putative cysteine protease
MTAGLTAAFAAPLIDHHDLDLDAAERVTYRIDQSFRYTYDTPVTSLSQRLVVVPRRRHGDMHRRAHALDITGAVTRRRTRQDATGNTVVQVRAAEVRTSVEFRVSALIERVRDSGWPVLPESALRDPRLCQATRLTSADDRLRTLAAEIRRPGGSPMDLAERACVAVHKAITYEYGVTNVATTAAEALAGGRGVCQDAAHVMVALCHLLQLPVRYVSGHLLGQGGTHAWVEVIVPDRDVAIAVALDPCHGRRSNNRYVTVAVGRDYADVAPASGSFVGSTGGQLTTTRVVGVVAVDRAAL